MQRNNNNNLRKILGGTASGVLVGPSDANLTIQQQQQFNMTASSQGGLNVGGGGTIDGSTGGSKKGFMQSFNDSQRSKPQFQEHFKHVNNESDVSDEDMGDIDENIINTKARKQVTEPTLLG